MEGGVTFLDARTGRARSRARVGDLYSVATFTRQVNLPGLRALTFTPDGKFLAAIANTNSIRVWDVSEGLERAVLAGAEDLSCLAFSPEGNTLAAGGLDGQITLWDVKTAQQRMSAPAIAPVHTLAFSPDGTALAALARDYPRFGEGALQVWQTDVPRAAVAPDAPVHAVSGAGPGWAALAGADETVHRLWLARLARKGLRPGSVSKHTSGGRPLYAGVATRDAAPAGQATRALLGEWELRKALAEALRDGKRPVAVTCAPGAPPRFEVTFAADGGRDWRFRHGLTSAALKEDLPSAQSRGEWPVVLFSLPTPAGPRFGVVLVRRPELNWEAELDLTSARLAKRLAEVKGKGLRPLYLAGYEQDRASRYAAVWSRPGAPPDRAAAPRAKGVNNLQPHALQPALRMRLVATNNCDLFYQDMAVFGRGLWNDDRHVLVGAMYGPTPKGASFELGLKAPRAGSYQLRLAATRAPDFARVQVSLDGASLGKPIEGYSPRVEPTGWVPLGAVRLTAGEHRLRFEMVGKHPRSTNHLFGVDGIDLVPAE
jgi:hypothetical protein